MNIEIGQKALITTDNWFYAPDGRQYHAVFGTVRATRTSKSTLGIDVSARSQNWYIEIGCMTIAGCQVHFAVRCDRCSFDYALDYTSGPEGIKEFKRPSGIFNADAFEVSP